MDERLSALADALAAVGDRWSPLLVASLLDGPLRFGELQQRVPGIAPNVLAARLRSLEGDGLLVATPYSERPPRFAYELTRSGHELAGALRMLTDWGARRGADAGEGALRHELCGTPLQAQWYCPTCQEPVAGGASGEAPDELYYA